MPTLIMKAEKAKILTQKIIKLNNSDQKMVLFLSLLLHYFFFFFWRTRNYRYFGNTFSCIIRQNMKPLWNESIRIDRIEAEDRWGPGANM